ncbi:PorV/PorQ family protein [bacterium]|nr:PorV/PorQ family protein [bacterium]
MKKTTVFVGIVIFSLFFVQIGQAGGIGTTALSYLNAPVGARAAALGGATAALADSAYSLFENASGLALLEKGEVSVSHQMGFAEINTEVLAMAYLIPRVAALGLGVIYQGQADIDNLPGEAPWKVYDLLVSLAAGKSLNEKLRLGGSLKFMNSTLGEYSANAFAVDLGFQYELHPVVSFGLVIQNMGTRIKYISNTHELPFNLKASVGARSDLAAEHGLGGAVDFVYGIYDELFSTRIGVEYIYAKTVSARAGYVLGNESLEGLSVGAGVHMDIYGLTYLLDYAFAPKLWNGFSQSDGEHTIALGIAF